MTEEIRYIANLQRQEEFDNEVTELKDELKRLEQENEKLRKENERLAETPQWRQIKDMANNNNYRNALEEIKEKIIICQDTFHTDIVDKINEVLQ